MGRGIVVGREGGLLFGTLVYIVERLALAGAAEEKVCVCVCVRVCFPWLVWLKREQTPLLLLSSSA